MNPVVVANNNPPAAAPARGPILPPAPRLAAGVPFGDQARGRAWRFIDYGDRHFREGRYRDAIRRYRKAAATDSTLAEALFRQGWAELARGELGRASVAMRRGLRLAPDWPSSAFVLEDLFDDAARKNAGQLIDEALRRSPNDVDARFVAGVLRHFDGEPDAARREFARVLELTGGDASARLFLPQEPPAGKAVN